MGKKVLVEYSSNNSGGDWWLKDKHWLALEKAGWTVQWGGVYFCGGSGFFQKRPKGKPMPCKDKKDCPGHRRADSYEEAKNGGDDMNWLGSYAKYAIGEFGSIDEAIQSWENATGMDASDEGCNCCGAPHSFSSRNGDNREYISGSEIAHRIVGEPETLDQAKALIARLRK